MKPGMGKQYASRAALEGYDAVYGAGGDGTLNDVASGLVERKTPFGIIPLGTGNGLARGLNIPFDIENIVWMFDQGKIMPLDVGKISSHYFFSVAGIGYEVFIAKDFNRLARRKRHFKMLVFLALKHYFLNRPEKVSVVIDGKETNRKIFSLTLCNTGQYGSGAVIAPQASAHDGKLTAVMIPKLNVISGTQAAFRLFKNTVHETKNLEYINFQSMKIIREKPGSYEVDGETYTGGTNLNVTILPGALQVIVP
jgi:YegS/Rv2252/BmrU family lipid kinase